MTPSRTSSAGRINKIESLLYDKTKPVADMSQIQLLLDALWLCDELKAAQERIDAAREVIEEAGQTMMPKDVYDKLQNALYLLSSH